MAHVTTSGHVWAGPQLDYGLCNGGECVSWLTDTRREITSFVSFS